MKQSYKITEKGISLYITIIILSVLLGISLALSTILIAQIKIIRGMEDSITAFYAADSGIEMELYEKHYLDEGAAVGDNYSGFLDLDGGGTGSNCPADLSTHPGDACYRVTITQIVPSYQIKSIGVFKKTRRAIEIEI